MKLFVLGRLSHKVVPFDVDRVISSLSVFCRTTGRRRFASISFTYATRSVLCLHVYQPSKATRLRLVSLMVMKSSLVEATR